VKQTGPVKIKRDKNSVRKIILICAAAVTAVVLIIGITALTLLNSKILQKGEGDLDSSINTQSEIKEKVVTFLLCGIDDESGRGLGQRTDVILLVNYDIAAKKINVLQIPRDTYVETTSSHKINAVYSESKKGIKGLASEISQMFQVSIDHYATIKMDGFKDLVDAVGGVTVDVKVDIDWGGGLTLKKGVQTLDGTHAEMLIRERHAYNTGDIGRLQTQRSFLAAFVEKVMSLSGTQLLSLIPAALNYISTDMTAAQILGYLDTVKSLQMSNIVMHLLPG
jgi:LCP family protein required for cell wall assembly